MNELGARFLKNRDVRLVLLAGVVIVILSFTPLRLASMLGVLLLWTWYWPFSKSLDSLLLRLAVTFALFTCSQQLIAMVCWALHVPVTVPLVVIMQLIVCLVMAGARALWPVSRVPVARWTDVTALVATVASVAVIALGTLHGGTHLQQMLRFVTTGYDNTQHVSLTMSLYENRGHVFGSVAETIDKTIFGNMSSYPQGWSMSASLWWHGVSSDLDIRQSPSAVLLLYFCMVMLWYALLIFLLCRLILRLAELVLGKASGIAGHVGAVLFTWFAELFFLVSLLAYGFASFYPALVLPLVLTFLLIELFEGNGRSGIVPARFLIGGLMLAAGMSFSWLLSAPVAFIMIALGLVQYFAGWRIAWKWACDYWYILLIALALVGVASMQGVIQLVYGVKDLVNIPGGINPINTTILSVILIATVIAVAYNGKKMTRNLFVAATSGAMLVAGAVFFFQVISSGQATYFSIKISFVAMLLILAFFSAVMLALVQGRMADQNWLYGTVFITGLVLFIPIASGMTLGTSKDGIGSINYIKGERYMAPVTAGVLSDLIAKKRAIDANLIVYRQQDFSEDVQGTHFMDVLLRRQMPTCHTELESDLVSGWSVSPDRLKECANGSEMYLVVSAKGYSQSLVDYADTPNIKVVLAY